LPSGVWKTDLKLAFGVRFLYTHDMPLITPHEAAKLAFVTDTMITHWTKSGLLKKYPTANFHKRNYLVDSEEVKNIMGLSKFEIILKRYSGRLISTKEAADILKVGTRMISYYAQMGYIKRHYVYGNKIHFAVDRYEILALPSQIEDRIHHRDRIEELREQVKKLKKDHRGWWVKSDSV